MAASKSVGQFWKFSLGRDLKQWIEDTDFVSESRSIKTLAARKAKDFRPKAVLVRDISKSHPVAILIL